MNHFVSLFVAAVLVVSCSPAGDRSGAGGSGGDEYAVLRERMVNRQIKARGVTDKRVLDAMRSVPRHLFVPPDFAPKAYDDGPLPIGWGQTISQPYIVALMTDLADLEPGDKVLEIGTGSGYQAAVLAQIVDEVYSIEILGELAASAAARLDSLGYANITVREGDGYRGWPEHAPFDAIVVTAAPGHVPEPLVEQLAVGGKLIIPVGSGLQELMEITRTEEGIVERRVIPVRFVPMTGEAQESRADTSGSPMRETGY